MGMRLVWRRIPIAWERDSTTKERSLHFDVLFSDCVEQPGGGQVGATAEVQAVVVSHVGSVVQVFSERAAWQKNLRRYHVSGHPGGTSPPGI